MPDGAKWIPMSEILTYEEIERICREAVRIGITRFKITGGEPLVRKGCADLIRMIRQIPGTEEVTMTTNGVLLGENLEDLLAAGLDAVNISLDTLIPEKYQEITGADELERVRKSIFMAEKSEIRVKLNTVLHKGVNDEEWKSLAELAKKPAVRLPLTMAATVILEQPVSLTATLPDGTSVTIQDAPPELAKNKPCDAAFLERQLGKLGNTAYQLDSLTAICD